MRLNGDSVKEGAAAAFYDAGAAIRGTGTLYIDDMEVGSGYVENVSFGISLEGTDIGRDSLTPVTPNYKHRGEFPFTGVIKEVVFDF